MNASLGSGQDQALRRLVLWPEFTGADWELPAGNGIPGQRYLIGWKMASERVDAGPPEAVARLLATVLCGCANVTFAAAIRPPIGTALLPRRWRLNRHFVWTTTANVDEARQGIFHGEPFGWTQRGQVVILSPSGTAVPLTEDHLQVGTDAAVFQELARVGALGVLLPGVDGAVAGLYLFTAPFGDTVRARLEEETGRVGAEFIVASADDLRALLRG